MSESYEFVQHLAALGVPIFTAAKAPAGAGEFTDRPAGWSSLTADENAARIAAYRPGDALMGLMGGPVAVVDVDPRNGGDVDAVRAALDGIGARVYGDVLTPGGGRHFYLPGHPDLPTCHKLAGFPGVDVQSFGAVAYLPGTQRPKYDGAGYLVLLDDLETLADGGDLDSGEALAGWVADRRPSAAATFEASKPWDGAPPDARQAAYLASVLRNQHAKIAAMSPDSGRNVAVYQAGMVCGNYIAGAGMDEAEVVAVLTDAAARCGLVRDDGERSVAASIRSGIRNGKQKPRAVPAAPDPLAWVPTPAPANVDTATGELRDEATPEDAALDAAYAFAVEVERESYKLRIRDAARVKVAAEKAAAEVVPPFDAGLLSEVLARPAEPPHRVEHLIPSEAGTLIVAQRKTGKTTMQLNLARSLILGGDFLGRFAVRPVTGRVGFLNFEVSAAQLARWAHEAGVPEDRLYLVNLRGRRNPFTLDADREHLAEQLRAHEVESLIVDPFGRAYTGKSQNDPGEVGAWLGELDRFARGEVGVSDVILAAHAGWDGERTRGSSALEDWADVYVTLVRDRDDDQERYLRAEGRDVLIEEDRLDFDPATRTLTLAGAGSRKTAARTRHLEQLLPAVVGIVKASPGITGYKIGQALREAGHSFQKGDESKAAALAVDRGLLDSETGARNSRRYFAPETASPPRPPHTSPAGKSDDLPDLPYKGEVVLGEVNGADLPEINLQPRRSHLAPLLTDETGACQLCGDVPDDKAGLGARGLCLACEATIPTSTRERNTA